jgi:hypothetical protein
MPVPHYGGIPPGMPGAYEGMLFGMQPGMPTDMPVGKREVTSTMTRDVS